MKLGRLRSLVEKETLLSFLGIYLTSRVLLLIVVTLTITLQLFPEPFGETTLRHPFLTISTDPKFTSHLEKELLQVLTLGDASHYASIAQGGYTARPFTNDRAENWAFFPLLPLLERLLQPLVGSAIIAGFLISLFASAASFFLLGKLMELRRYDRESITRAQLFLFFFPTSHFLSLPITEALFLALSLAAFIFAEQRKPIHAGLTLGIASTCRPWGVLLLPALLLLWWKRERGVRPLMHPRYLIGMALVPVGLIAFMTHLWIKTGNPFAFVDIQNQWGREKFALISLFRSLPSRLPVIVEDWNFVSLNGVAITLVFTAAYFFWRRKEYDFVAALLLPLFSAINTGTSLSCHRYAVTLFPMMIFLAEISRTRARERFIFGACLVLFTLFAVLLALHTTAAIA